MYCTPIWKIRKVVYKAQVADTLIHKLEIENNQLEGALRAADESAKAAREATDAAIEAGAHLENQVKLTEEKATYWEHLSKKWKRAAIGGGVIIILELLAILMEAVAE